MGEAARICPACGGSDWGTRSRCNPCTAKKAREKLAKDPAAQARDRERMRKWRKANPEKRAAQDRRHLYGLDSAGYEALLASQEGLCAICREPNPTCVDHCHRTGRVRGVLCRPCNAALGQFRDDPELLLAAATYVEVNRREVS